MDLPIRHVHKNGRGRTKPYRKCPGIVLDQDSDKPLHGSENDAVEHDRSVPFSIAPHIGQVKSFGHGKIHLDRGTLPSSVECIFQLDINLRTIKSPVRYVNTITKV